MNSGEASRTTERDDMNNIDTNNTEPAFLIRIGFKWHTARSRTLDAAKREAAAMQSPIFTAWCPVEVYEYSAAYRSENCIRGEMMPLASKNSFRSEWK